MGHDDRERREAARARLEAAGITPPKQSGMSPGLTIALVVLLVAVATGGYVWWHNRDAGGEPTYTATRNGVVVTAGKPDAPVTVDVYEDYLCPSCKQFEQIYANEITTALNEGKAKVNYHHIAILDDRSAPAGYSSRAGNAALCAADAGIFPTYHARLYTDQPAEGAAGKTVQELTAIGTELHATGDFAGCVSRQENTKAIADATTAAAADPAAAPGGKFGTPTVLVGGKKIDINDSAWLSNAISAAGR